MAANVRQRSRINWPRGLREPRPEWMHCANGKKPMHFATPEEACAAIAEMSKAQIPHARMA